MDDKNVRVLINTMIKVDPTRERFISEALDWLKCSNNQSKFVASLIRMAFSVPNSVPYIESMKSMQSMLGIGDSTDFSNGFFEKNQQKINEMYAKVNKMYDMCVKMYTLAELGGRLGLSDKSKCLASAEFLVEKQLSELSTDLGFSRQILESDKCADMEKLSSDIIEYMLNSYNSIISELRCCTTMVQTVVQEVPQTVRVKKEEPMTLSVGNSVEKPQTVVEKPMEHVEAAQKDSPDLDAVVDFGDIDPDIDDIASFLGIGDGD